MIIQPKLYHELYSIMYNRKSIPVPVGSRKVHTTIIHDNKAPEINIKLKMTNILCLDKWHHIFHPLEIKE